MATTKLGTRKEKTEHYDVENEGRRYRVTYEQTVTEGLQRSTVPASSPGDSPKVVRETVYVYDGKNLTTGQQLVYVLVRRAEKTTRDIEGNLERIADDMVDLPKKVRSAMGLK